MEEKAQQLEEISKQITQIFGNLDTYEAVEDGELISNLLSKLDPSEYNQLISTIYNQADSDVKAKMAAHLVIMRCRFHWFAVNYLFFDLVDLFTTCVPKVLSWKGLSSSKQFYRFATTIPKLIDQLALYACRPVVGSSLAYCAVYSYLSHTLGPWSRWPIKCGFTELQVVKLLVRSQVEHTVTDDDLHPIVRRKKKAMAKHNKSMTRIQLTKSDRKFLAKCAKRDRSPTRH